MRDSRRRGLVSLPNIASMKPPAAEPENAVPVTNLRLLDRALQDGQLMAKHQILGSHICRVTEDRPKQHHQDPKNAHSPAFPTLRKAGIVRGNRPS